VVGALGRLAGLAEEQKATPEMMMSAVTERVLAACGKVEQLAWADYLEACRSAHPFSYEEVEAWAWTRLQRELKVLKKEASP
jgi:hypothetical protein